MAKERSAKDDMDAAFERSLRKWVKSDDDVFPEPYESLEAAISWAGGVWMTSFVAASTMRNW